MIVHGWRRLAEATTAAQAAIGAPNAPKVGSARPARPAGRPARPRRPDRDAQPASILWGWHQGADVWVVGTGTSLAGFDFRRLAGRVTIALNDAVFAPGLDPAYHLWHDTGLAARYRRADLPPRTVVLCSKNCREGLAADTGCPWRARAFWWAHSGCDVEETSSDLYVDRTIATAGIQLAWKLGAARIFLLGVDGYKLRKPGGGEAYYWTGAAKPPERRKEREVAGLVVQDRHEAWAENMRRLRRFFARRGLFTGKWPGRSVYNLSARSTVDAWEKVDVETALKDAH